MVFDYHNLSLKQPDHQIRLLHLLRDNDDADIQVGLQVYEIKDCPPYAAISYTWGEEKPTITITVNDQPFRVRMNCWYALWQMRHHNQHSVLWIDCICIDQSNVEEKNSQVAKMGEIFSRADITALCLGPGRSLAAAQSFFESTKDRNVLKPDKDSLKELQYKSYFRRIWIKQEVILSKRVTLFCGMDSLDWDTFENIINAAAEYDIKTMKSGSERHPKSKDVADSVHTSLIESRKRHRLFSREAGSHSTPWAELWRLLATYGDAECQDPRDKVYALLPLMPDDLRSQLYLSIDYRLPPLHLSLELAGNYIAELSAVTELDQPSNQGSDTIWQTLIHSVQYWFRPKLSDPDVSNFAARWYATQMPPASNITQLNLPEQPIWGPKYCPMVVLQRFTIVDDIDATTNPFFSFLDDVGNRIFNSTNAMDDMTNGFPHDNVATISKVMLVKDVRSYLKSVVLGTSAKDPFGPLFESEGYSNLSVLPPDLEIKIVILANAYFGYGLHMIYLVSAKSEIGDQLLHCQFCDPHSDRIFVPMVRTYDRVSKSSSRAHGELRYSLLTGWALQLDYNGSLLPEPPTSMSMEFPFAELTFNVYYEDFILYAILLLDFPAYLTRPCTHQEHPSFVAEDRSIKENNTADLPDWASVIVHPPHIEGMSRGERKAETKKVSFA